MDTAHVHPHNPNLLTLLGPSPKYMLRRIILLAAFSIYFLSARAQTTAPLRHCQQPEHWTPVKPPLPAGAEAELLEGDPKSDGIFTMRLRLPPNYSLAPHTHPTDERVTVLSGHIFVGVGDSLDASSAREFTAGCFYVNPAGLHHYVYSGKDGAVIQLTCQGPWGIEFISRKE